MASNGFYSFPAERCCNDKQTVVDSCPTQKPNHLRVTGWTVATLGGETLGTIGYVLLWYKEVKDVIFEKNCLNK